MAGRGLTSLPRLLYLLVTSHSLHRCGVDDLNRAAKRGFEVKADPTFGEIMRFGKDTIPDHRPRVANRYHFVIPIRSELLDSVHHLSGRESWTRKQLSRLLLSRDKDLDVGPADINC